MIGVAPPEFNGTLLGLVPEVYVPIQYAPRLRATDLFDGNSLEARYYTWLHILGRMKSGVTLRLACYRDIREQYLPRA